jgi:pyruvate, orthophosphate dikinase
MKNRAIRKVLSLLLAFSLIFQQTGFAQGIAQLNISKYFGTFLGPEQFRPLQLRYFSYNPLTDNFQILLDKGSLKKVEDSQLKEQGQELLKYFLVGVALPDDNFWVNLRPDSEGQIISQELARTDVGKILLEADLQLKKDVAKFTSPETPEGREYWNKLYQKAGQIFNLSEITIPTLTRPWIVPGEVIIRETANSAYVYKGTLKVMLEQDHLKSSVDYSFADPRLKELNEYSSQLIREEIIPKLTQEINSSTRYAALRQVFFSLILSRWFKSRFVGKTGQYANLINSGNLNGLTSQQVWSKTTYFQEYKKSFAKGEYNLKEQVNAAFGPVIRSYFSGGIAMQDLKMPGQNAPSLTGTFTGSSSAVTAALGKGMVTLTGKALPGALTVTFLSRTGTITASLVQANGAATSSPITADKPAVYYFGTFSSRDDSLPKGRASGRADLGGKGANLAEMANELSTEFNKRYEKQGFKLNVPPGFTSTTIQTALWRERARTITDEQRENMTLIELVRATLGKPLIDELIASLRLLEETMGKKLGDIENDPLLIAVRSGAAESMAGMMDTILNLGLNDKSVLALAKARNGDYRFAFDTYRRFIEMFGRTVLGVEENEKAQQGFKYILQDMIKETGRKEDDLQAEDLKIVVERYKKEIQRQGIKDGIPDDPIDQYLMAVYTVMKSSFSKRSMIVRKKEGFKLEDTLSAVNVLPMIYGNRDGLSGSGVAFSRDLRDGKRVHNLEFNFKCQGEDVVSGRKKGLSLDELRKANPQLAANLEAILDFLEEKYKNVQDVEFTFEHDPKTGEIKLWILQARNAKRTAMAEVRTAVEMVKEGLISIKQAIKRITPVKMVELFVVQFDKNDKKKALDQGRLLSNGGLDASPGAGTGVLVFDSGRAEEIKARIDSIKERLKNGEVVSDKERYLGKTDLAMVDGVILCREETEPADINGMLASVGFWTKRGGRTSHAAVVARQMGKPAVVGDDNIEPDFKTGTVRVLKSDGSYVVLEEGDIISLDGTGEGSRGQVFAGKIETIPSPIAVALYKESLDKVRNMVVLLEEWKKSASGNMLIEYETHLADLGKHIAKYSNIELTDQEKAFYAQYKQFMQWVKETGHMPVAANAEKPLDVEYANLVGANNFGLVRTEHRFSGAGRELLFQRFILADILPNPEEARREVLKEIIQIQQVDNELLFLFADGKPVTIRFMDPPLHEFTPKSVEKIIETALAFMLGKERLEPALKTANKLLQEAKEKNTVLSENENIELFARAAGLSVQDLSAMLKRVKVGIEALREENPMFGTRGCRLSTIYPEIQEMESEAIFNAVNKVKQAGIEVKVELMVPLVGNAKEFIIAKEAVERAAAKLGVDRKSFLIGTMIEIVAGVMNIRELLEAGIEFISFGTNDLTQGVLKISRDDGKEWLRIAQLIGIFDDDPSVTISPEVALFIKRVMEAVRAYNLEHDSKVKAGICGEQGLDAKSIIRYLAPYGLDYVSGSPRGIPGARVAAAQAKIITDEAAASKIEQPGIEGLQPEAKGEEETGPKFRIMEVTTKTDKPIETTSTIGMIEIESAFFDSDTRYRIQKFLLSDKFMSVEETRELHELTALAFFSKRFAEHIRKIAKAGQTVSIRLPDLALGAIFEYGSEVDLEAVIARLSKDLKMTELEVRMGIAKFHEANPAIGTRGMRAFVLPRVSTLYNAIAVAAASVASESGNQTVDIILPFLTNGWELEAILNGFKTDNGETIVSSLRETLQRIEGVTARFGAVIETPAAVVTAKDIVEHADFLVIDVKKLTEAVWAAFEKDTRAGFFKVYMEKGIWEKDPFIHAPKEVRELIQEAITAARQEKLDLEVRVVTNSKDEELIDLAIKLKVDSLIVSPEDDRGGALAKISASSPIEAQKPGAVGGIDFRVINMITQPMGNFSGLKFSLPKLNNLENINLNEELGQIQKMLQSGIIPSGERLKEYVGACHQKGKLKEHLDGIIGCLVDMCRLEEEKAIETTNELKEILLIIDSA